MFWEMQEGAVRSAMALPEDFPLAAYVPGRSKATYTSDSPILLCEAGDACRAVWTVDKINAVDEEGLGNAVREVLFPA